MTIKHDDKIGEYDLEDFLWMLENADEEDAINLIKYKKYHEDKVKYNKLLHFRPDEWFMELPKVMLDEPVCAAISGNRSGKSYQSTWLYALHLTGLYDEVLGGYSGYKFKQSIDTWILTATSEQFNQAGGLQEYLFGGLDDVGTGWIPKDRIISYEMGVGGTKGFIKKAKIRHKDGGVSTMEFKGYAQSVISLMGASISLALIDEEAPYNVFTQVITRTATPKTGTGTGRVVCSLTPEKGMTDTVREFFEGHYVNGLIRGTVYDCSHLTDDDIEGIKKRYPVAQHDMR